MDSVSAALKQSEARYRTLFDQAPVGVLTFDDALRLTDCNARFATLFRVERAHLIGVDLYAVLEPSNIAALRRVLAGESPEYEGLYTAPINGVSVWVSTRLSPIRDDDGRVVGGMGIVEDISARKVVEASLQKSEARFRALIEAAPDAIGVFRDGRRLFANPALVRFLGYDRAEEIVGLSVIEMIHPEDRAMFAERGRRRSGGEVLSPQEYRLLRRDGRMVTAEITSMLMDYEGAPAVLCHMRDVTERKHLQSQLLMADRMIAVGRLAAGVAHEINNPLAYVMANLEHVASRLLPPLLERAGRDGAAAPRELTETARLVEVARAGAERMRDIVRDLKTFSHADDARRTALDVREVLDASVAMAWNEIRHRAQLVKDYGDVPAVEANASRLGQVFLNLLVNAAQAMPAGDAKRNEVRLRTSTRADGWALVEVCDTGPGIPSGIVGRIFDPFFTTKPVGVGTGLGLSICRGIVTALGGTIAVANEPARGTRFSVALPPSRSAGLPRDSVPPGAPAEPSARRGRVLVIDDEAAVARALRLTLSGEHEVALAGNAREALALLARDRGFDVVLCDVMMPDMTGMDLWERLAREYPELATRVVFVTGGAFTAAAREFLEEPGRIVLEKPFDLPRLRALLRERVRGAPAG